MNNEIRELRDEICELSNEELHVVTGGNLVGDFWRWLTDDSAKYDPVKACPQCYAGGGHGVRA